MNDGLNVNTAMAPDIPSPEEQAELNKGFSVDRLAELYNSFGGSDLLGNLFGKKPPQNTYNTAVKDNTAIYVLAGVGILVVMVLVIVLMKKK